MSIKAETSFAPSKVPLKQAFSKEEKVPRYEADEDVLNLNNIIMLFSHQSPIFHNKAIVSFLYIH